LGTNLWYCTPSLGEFPKNEWHKPHSDGCYHLVVTPFSMLITEDAGLWLSLSSTPQPPISMCILPDPLKRGLFQHRMVLLSGSHRTLCLSVTWSWDCSWPAL
jgi:hypothetical protein